VARTLIRAHTILTQSASQPTISPAGIVVEDSQIRQVGAMAELEPQGGFDSVLGDPERHLVTPGFVNGHHHSLRPARIGLRSSPLEGWLVRNRLRQAPSLSLDQLYDHTLWGTLQFLKSGATAVIDHYPVDPRVEDLGVPAAVRAYIDAGVRAAVCLACADQQQFVYDDDQRFVNGLPGELAESLRPRLRPFDQDGFFATWERLAKRFDGAAGRVRIGFGPGGPQWCSDDLLRRIRRTADEHKSAPVQIHLVESSYQALYGHRRYGHSIVRHLDEIGFLGEATSGAHGVWVDSDDIRLLAERGTVVVHNPSSNLVLFNGIAPVADMLAGGMRVGFGLDAAGLNDTQDYLSDLRLAFFLQRRPGWDRPQVTADDLLAMGTYGGAPALGMGSSLGKLEAGYQADLVFVDRTRLYGSPYIHPDAPAADVLVRRATAADVEHVMVAGRLVIEQGRAVGIDEAALNARVAASLEPLYDGLASADDLFEQLEPHVADFYRAWEAESFPSLTPNYLYNQR
jgi:5-methylthioadenosine/S-adenosylhomocysteine deaminase